MLPLLALRHIACEGPGLLGTVAERRGVEIRIAEMPDEFPRWPEPEQYSALVVLGGPMSVHDHQRYAWLKDEARLLRRCMDAHIPILGVCLGAQILATACGGRVHRGDSKEIGWGDVRLLGAAHRDPVFGGLPSPLSVFHWHGDTFTLPQDSRLLAQSDLTPHQAFRFEDRYYGLQFHLEVTAEMATEWATVYADELAETGGPTVGGGPDTWAASAETLRPHAEAFFHRWLDLVERCG